MWNPTHQCSPPGNVPSATGKLPNTRLQVHHTNEVRNASLSKFTPWANADTHPNPEKFSSLIDLSSMLDRYPRVANTANPDTNEKAELLIAMTHAFMTAGEFRGWWLAYAVMIPKQIDRLKKIWGKAHEVSSCDATRKSPRSTVPVQLPLARSPAFQ